MFWAGLQTYRNFPEIVIAVKLPKNIKKFPKNWEVFKNSRSFWKFTRKFPPLCKPSSGWLPEGCFFWGVAMWLPGGCLRCYEWLPGGLSSIGVAMWLPGGVSSGVLLCGCQEVAKVIWVVVRSLFLLRCCYVVARGLLRCLVVSRRLFLLGCCYVVAWGMLRCSGWFPEGCFFSGVFLCGCQGIVIGCFWVVARSLCLLGCCYVVCLGVAKVFWVVSRRLFLLGVAIWLPGGC